jgi:hypothetical protein
VRPLFSIASRGSRTITMKEQGVNMSTMKIISQLSFFARSRIEPLFKQARPDQHHCQEQSEEATEERGGSETALGVKEQLRCLVLRAGGRARGPHARSMTLKAASECQGFFLYILMFSLIVYLKILIRPFE